MTAVTPDVLLARLTEIYKATSQEDLARKINVPLRSLSRWSSGRGIHFDTAVELFMRAGWLNLDDGEVSLGVAQRERARHLARTLADELEELTELLGPPVEAEES